MAQVDELERLAALHRSGALTDEEFESAKAGLLSPRLGRRVAPLALAGALLIALIGAAAVWMIYLAQPGERQAASGNSVSAQVAVTPSGPQQGSASPAVPMLQRLFQRDMLDVQVSYLEHMIGPARNVLKNVRTYVVEGCEVTVTTNDNAVVSLGIPTLSHKCTVSLKDFGLDGPPADQLTFGSFENISIGMKFSADCISSCGNAYDPSVYALVETPHSNGFLNFRPGVVLDDGKAIDASEKWAAGMSKAEGDDYVISTRFNCDQRYDELALQLFRDVRITSVEIGTIPAAEGC